MAFLVIGALLYLFLHLLIRMLICLNSVLHYAFHLRNRMLIICLSECLHTRRSDPMIDPDPLLFFRFR